MEQIVMLGQIALAMILGGAIGYEREVEDKPAGLRTHMLVAGGSALLVLLSDFLVAATTVPVDVIRTDPIRMMQAVVTGISFLGAGTILRSREQRAVYGLTTAAALLFTAGIGAAVAAEQYVLSVGGALLVLGTLRGVALLGARLGVESTAEREEQ